MLLNGILKIAIGISGIIATISWFYKSGVKTDTNNIDLYNKEKKYSENITRANYKPVDLSFPIEEIRSTVLLDNIAKDSEVEETVLLENDDLC